MSSLKFNNVYINNYYSIAGPKERLGKIKNYDLTFKDYYFGEKTFEKAEIKMQSVVLDYLLKNNSADIILGGDLSNQITNSTYAARNYNTSFLGLYSACATFAEELLVASNLLETNQVNSVICLTSSHNLTAEKEFRFPIEYGSPKKVTSTFTATGCVGCLLTNNQSNIKVESATIGKIIDLDWKDPNHFGAAMAPAAADTIFNHLKDLGRNADYYDVILTGDLGKIGSKILIEYMREEYNIILKNHLDAGTEIFCNSQDVNSGSSGPVTIPLVFFNRVIKNTQYKKILLVATGALHSPLMLNQKESIPAIAHAVSFEVIK